MEEKKIYIEHICVNITCAYQNNINFKKVQKSEENLNYWEVKFMQ